MSYFYGTIKGTKGEATRCGHKSSGMLTTAASWSGAVRVELSIKNDEDWAAVYLIPWKGTGVFMRLYDGPVNPTPAGDVDAALRCRTCVNFNQWKAQCNSSGENS